MVHKLFQASSTNTTNVPANQAGAVLKRAAVIGIMFAYECVPAPACAPCSCLSALLSHSPRSSRVPHSPLGNNGTFMNKFAPIFQGISGKVNGSAGITTDTDAPAAMFDLMADVFAVIGKTAYFTYPGSLTTPPCSEGITWFLMQNPMYASPSQILQFTSTLAIEQKTAGRGSDNRLVQPLLARTIYSSVAI